MDPSPPLSGDYHRPHQAWTCGGECEGAACARGPTPQGVCGGTTECVPYRTGGDWQCGRPSQQGGACAEGPTASGVCNRSRPPCAPLRSLRAVRGQFVFGCLAVTLGAAHFLLSSPARNEILVPGPLSQPHAQALATDDPHRCAACHAADRHGFGDWLLAAVNAREAMQPAQSTLCLECHRKQIPPAVAHAPHTFDETRLAALTEDACQRLGRNGPRPHDRGLDSLACARCHREHHGADHNLAALTNRQCSQCHQQTFVDLAAAHPEFDGWPYRRRTRIAFDHTAHAVRYFAEANRAFSCQSCHMDRPSGKVRSMVGFDQACASCHAETLDQSLAEGLPVLAIPMLDPVAMKDAGVAIQGWPVEATGDFDGPLPPLSRLLLRADPEAAAILATLDDRFSFGDLDPLHVEDCITAAGLGRALRRLADDLQRRGATAVAERISQVLDTNVTAETLPTLAGGLPAGLPVRPQGSGVLPPNAAARPRQTDALDLTTGPAQGPVKGTWKWDSQTLELRFYPKGHANIFLKEWLDLLVARTTASSLPDALSPLHAELTGPYALGQCLTCHSVDRTTTGRVVINWSSQPSEALSGRPFTKFSHAPHLSLPALEDCQSCHAMNRAVDVLATYAEQDPHRFQPGFVPLSKAQCTACHAAGEQVGGSCVTCHNYHVQE